MQTVAVSVDNLAEAADLGRAHIAAPLPPGANPALDVGFPALLAMLDQVQVEVTWFVEGWNASHHPEAVAEIVRRGHTVGAHGWVHEAWGDLAAEEETALLDRALDALGHVIGAPPIVFRAPGGRRTTATLDLLASRGVALDASLGPQGETSTMPVRTPEGPIWLGFDWALVDATYWLWDDLSPPEGAARVRSALATAAPGPEEVAVLIIHPHITGMDPARVAAIETVLAELVAAPDVHLVTLPSLISSPDQPTGR